MGNYDDQHRFQRQHSPDRTNDYISQPPPPSSHSYQQTYGLSRSVTLPESQHNSRRSNNYNIPNRQTYNDNDMQHDGIKKHFILFLSCILL
jgi:hypothetical protein